MIILFYSHLTSEFSQLVEAIQNEYSEHQFISAQSKTEYLQGLATAEILVTGNPSDSDLSKALLLKLLIVPFAGISQLNFPLLRDKEIQVANSHGNAPIVAEKALALAMACCGRIVEYHNDQKIGNWHRTGNFHKPFDYWNSIIGRKITILGTGAIGINIAGLLKGFNCRIKGFRKKSESIPLHFDSVTSDLRAALDFGDIIFFALPITGSTEHMISNQNIDLLYDKFVINIGRGKLIEERPFYEALKAGKIRGAALDAWYEYPGKETPLTTGSSLPFSTLPNVVISPHAASHALEGKKGQLTGVLKVLRAYLKDRTVLNEIKGDY